MFSKFLIKGFILNQRYLFNNNSHFKILKNNFSQINKRRSKKIGEKSRIKNTKTGSKDEKINTNNAKDTANSNETSRIKNKKTENKEEKINTNNAKDTANSRSHPFTPDDMRALQIFSVTLICSGSFFFFKNASNINKMEKVTFEEFERDYLQHGEVKRVKLHGNLMRIICGSNIEVSLHHDYNRQFQEIAVTDISINDFPLKLRLAEKALKIPLNDSVPINFGIAEKMIWFGCFGRIFTMKGFTRVNPQQQRPPDIIKTTRKPFPNFMSSKIKFLLKEEMPNIKFEDVAGLHSAKVEIKEFVDYLKNPNQFIRLGAHLPKGAMLLGPPGCGKTLLVKALASESSTPFFYKSGPEFVETIGGLGARNIRDLFTEARAKAPCIIFIDEIDSIGKKRGGPIHDKSDSDQTLNQLLVEMDGMASVNGVVVFAATNRPDVLDAALLRRGRFDRHIHIDLPFLKEREEIFNLYLKKFENKLESSIQILSEKLACQTPGMSGADIANICNEAALVAAKHNYSLVKDECFDSALERIVEGAVKKSNILSKSDKKIIAYHEAGHVIVSWLLKNTDPIVKVSIIERTNNKFGFMSYNKENSYLLSTEKLCNQIAVFLGGRAAELLIFNKLTSGAEDDLKNVRKIALKMIRNWGMSEKIGHFCYNVPDDDGPNRILPYSKYTEELIDSEVSKIVVSSFKLAQKIIKENIKHLELIATELLKKEVLSYKDIEILIGPRPQ